MDQLIAQYEELMARSDTGGAFPGSKSWLRAQPFAAQLRALVAAHPEIEPERARRAAAARESRLTGKDVGGL